MAEERKLTAILFTDIVGSTAVTARSESAGLAQRDRHRAVVRPFVQAHHGRLIESPGDASLSIFDSALDAVHCALAIQAAIDADEALQLHIGVHLGETVLRGHEVFGDSVNVAARICALSDGSAPYVSGEVQHAVQNQTHLRFESLGAHELKNVPRPVAVCRVTGAPRPPRRRALRQRLGIRYPRRWLAAAVLIPALAGLGLWLRYRPAALSPIRSLAVLPLENLSGDPSQDYFADGMTETLIGDLGKIGSLRVISRTSVLQYKDARKPLREIAAELGVDALLEGSVIREGERVRVSAQLIDGRTDHHLWAERYDRELRGILELQSDVARAVARAVEIELSPAEATRLADLRPVDPAAHDALLDGLHQLGTFTPGSMHSAIASFERATETDPGYALAHSWKAFTWLMLTSALYAVPDVEGMPRAKAAALRALEADDELALAHGVLGGVALLFDWDWAASERHYQRAFELNPSQAWAHAGYAWHLMSRGRHEEAIAEMHRAVELAPFDLLMRGQPPGLYFFMGRYDAARERIVSSGGRYPLLLAGTLEAVGRYEEAIAAVEKVPLAGPEAAVALRAAFSRAGTEGYWRERLRIARSLPVPQHIQLAGIRARLGERNEAFAELELAYAAREGDLVWLRTFPPGLDPLRDAPRFLDLIRRIGIPES